MEDTDAAITTVAYVVGKELRDIRVKSGLSQEALAFRAGVSRNYISLLELDVKSPTLATLGRICKVLGIRMSVLIARAERRTAHR